MAMNDIAQMIAQARANSIPQVHQGQAQVLRGSGVQKAGRGEVSDRYLEESGKGIGAFIAGQIWENTPDGQRQKAMFARQLFSGMTSEGQKLAMSKPEVQKQFREYEKYAPELFADSDKYFNDPGLRGMITFIPEAAPQVELEAKQAEAGYKTALKKGQEQETQFQKEDRPIDIQSKKAEVQQKLASARSANVSAKVALAQNEREQEMHPLQMKMMKAQTEHYLASRDAELSKVSDGSFKDVMEIRKNTDTQLTNQWKSSLIRTPQEYATGHVQATQSMVSSMGFAKLPNVNVPVPAAITKPEAMVWVRESINTAFKSVFYNNNMNPRQMKQLYHDADALFQRTYGYLMSPGVMDQIPGIENYIDPDVVQKMVYLQYMATKDEMTPEDREKTRQALRQNFPFPETEGESKGWFKSLFDKSAGDVEQSALMDMGQ